MKLRIEIDLPDPVEIISQGCPVPIARQSAKWSGKCLGRMSQERGVYVIHHAGKIKYVGKTDGPAMYFARRLRAEFRERSSRGKHIYPKLSKLQVPPEVMVRCYPTSEIEQRIEFSGNPPRRDQMIAIFEIAMINHLEPEFQQHYIDAGVRKTQQILRKTMNLTIDPSKEQMLRERIDKNLRCKEKQLSLKPFPLTVHPKA